MFTNFTSLSTVTENFSQYCTNIAISPRNFKPMASIVFTTVVFLVSSNVIRTHNLKSYYCCDNEICSADVKSISKLN